MSTVKKADDYLSGNAVQSNIYQWMWTNSQSISMLFYPLFNSIKWEETLNELQIKVKSISSLA